MAGLSHRLQVFPNCLATPGTSEWPSRIPLALQQDIPANIHAILLPAGQAVDTLSHVAIRARNQEAAIGNMPWNWHINFCRSAILTHQHVSINKSLQIPKTKQMSLAIACSLLPRRSRVGLLSDTSEEKEAGWYRWYRFEDTWNCKIVPGYHGFSRHYCGRWASGTQHSSLLGRVSPTLVSIEESLLTSFVYIASRGRLRFLSGPLFKDGPWQFRVLLPSPSRSCWQVVMRRSSCSSWGSWDLDWFFEINFYFSTSLCAGKDSQAMIAHRIQLSIELCV